MTRRTATACRPSAAPAIDGGRRFHGKAIDARLIRPAGRTVYAIGIVQNGTVPPVVIRGTSPHANSSPVRSGIRLNQR